MPLPVYLIARAPYNGIKDMADVSGVMDDFEAFEPHPLLSFDNRTKCGPEEWPIVVPTKAPAVPSNLPEIIEKMIKETWKDAKPTTTGVPKFAGRIGSNRAAQDPFSANFYEQKFQKYHPQVRPTAKMFLSPQPSNAAISKDWGLFNTIKRTNAVTFRGDSRPPVTIINTAGGFSPPDTRTDETYLKGSIFGGFADYMDRRYQRTVSQEDFMQAVNKVLVTDQSRKLFIDYMYWRQITARESAHLARMVENELLKGYISTSMCIDTCMPFATRTYSTSGWIYLVIVLAAFYIPYDATLKQYWSSKEGEIAQFGAIPGERIVGFRYLDNGEGMIGPVFMRKNLRFTETKAFEYAFDVMCGMTPKSSGYQRPPNVFKRPAAPQPWG